MLPAIVQSNEGVDPLASNKELADAFNLIAQYYDLDRDTYRSKTFREAAAKIAQAPNAILSGAQAKRELGAGIGKSTMEAIDEFISTGQIKRLQELQTKHQEEDAVIKEFTSYFGIGPVTAMKYYNQGFRTLEDLWFRGNLTEAQKTGILWRDHINRRIDRSEIDLIRDRIGSILGPYGIRFDIAGSYRRGEASSGDIDVLVEGRSDLNMVGLIQLLQPILPATLAMGQSKYMGIIRLSDDYYGHRIDIRIIEKQSYAYGLLYFTGSQRFNILCRQRAIDLGLTLNEYGLYDQYNRSYPAATEQDIFHILGLKYLPPEARTKTIPYLEPE